MRADVQRKRLAALYQTTTDALRLYALQVGDVVRQTRAYVLKEGKSGEYAKRGHGARPFEDYVPIMFPCDGEVLDVVLSWPSLQR